MSGPSGTMVIIVNGKVESVNKNGQMFAPEEGERCPVCGAGRQTITVGSWGK